jgi:hypothetical protein
MPNRLAASTSPYLRQHAENPVDWREWGEEAFAEARARDVPIFLSVGYSSCHWCHVMAHESAAQELRRPFCALSGASCCVLYAQSVHRVCTAACSDERVLRLDEDVVEDRSESGYAIDDER